MKEKFFRLFILVCFVFMASSVMAKDFKVAIKQMSSTNDYIALINAIAEATGNKVSIEVVPPARAEYLLVNDLVNIQIPQLKLFKNKDSLKFDFSSMVMFETAFILYSNKNKPIDLKSLTADTKLVIEADPTLIPLFTVKCSPMNNNDSAFKKLSAGRIDGFIQSQFTGDTALKNTGLKNITRQLYFSAPVSMSIKKGSAGGEIDKMLTDGYNKLKASGRYDKIMGGLAKNARYNDWQP